MVNIYDLQAAYEQAIRHPTSNSTVRFIPSGTSRRKARSKKGSPRGVRRAARAAAARGRPLRVMFAAEARFGRINRLAAMLGAGQGQTRSRFPTRAVREFIFTVRSAPRTGAYLVMPTSNTERFQRNSPGPIFFWFSTGLPTTVPRLVFPDNISLLFLPPYSPELNPKEMSGTKSARSLRTTPSNPSTPSAPSSSRPSSI